MKSEFIGAGPYLAAFSRLLECIEITTRRGEPLPLDEGIGSITEAIVSLKTRSGKAFLIGNGGSAAIVSHVHNVPASDYGYVETAHAIVAHCITDMAAMRASVSAPV